MFAVVDSLTHDAMRLDRHMSRRRPKRKSSGEDLMLSDVLGGRNAQDFLYRREHSQHHHRVSLTNNPVSYRTGEEEISVRKMTKKSHSDTKNDEDIISAPRTASDLESYTVYLNFIFMFKYVVLGSF